MFAGEPTATAELSSLQLTTITALLHHQPTLHLLRQSHQPQLLQLLQLVHHHFENTPLQHAVADWPSIMQQLNHQP